jgi:hypothetical protein
MGRAGLRLDGPADRAEAYRAADTDPMPLALVPLLTVETGPVPVTAVHVVHGLPLADTAPPMSAVLLAAVATVLLPAIMVSSCSAVSESAAWVAPTAIVITSPEAIASSLFIA